MSQVTPQPNEAEMTDAEIAMAYWHLLAEKHNELQAAHDRLAVVMAEVYVAKDVREDNQQNAERAVNRLSDDVIILGQVIERARSARLVTVGTPK